MEHMQCRKESTTFMRDYLGVEWNQVSALILMQIILIQRRKGQKSEPVRIIGIFYVILNNIYIEKWVFLPITFDVTSLQ